MQLVEIASGPGKNIYTVDINGKCPIQEYLEGLDGTILNQFLALIDQIADEGPPTNRRKFRHIGDKIYELKTYTGGRILSFFLDDILPQSLILTHGFSKPPQKTLKREKAKALKYKSDLERQLKKDKKITIK